MVRQLHLDLMACLGPLFTMWVTHSVCGMPHASLEIPPAISHAAARNDATLTDICPIDRQHAWAVGDRGVIWHTCDGGISWDQQNSPVTCRLHSVCFVDIHHGWAAGGSIKPYSHTTRGVILHTQDGGLHWQVREKLLLPALRKIQFFDRHQGIAVGQNSALFPCGIFATSDGGRTWKPLSLNQKTAWQTGHFLNPTTGAVVDRLERVATVRGTTIKFSHGWKHRRKTPQALTLQPSGFGWLVGHGGRILHTSDLGGSWQTVSGKLPRLAREEFDLNTIGVAGNHCWVAGRPGSRIFHSSDGGLSWQTQKTGHRLPLHGLTFLDAQTGWAVGAMGTILATRDGGTTWKTQRSGGKRVSLLGIFSHASQIPLELYAHLSGAQGYLGVAEILGRLTAETADVLNERTNEALVRVGASGAHVAWQFSFRPASWQPSAARLLEHLDQKHGGKGQARLCAHLVRQIRMWRPDVIVTHPASVRNDPALGPWINQLVLRAVQMAADPTLYTETTDVGLSAWTVSKVFGSLGGKSLGSIHLDTAQLEPRLGGSLAQRANHAAGFLTDHYEVRPPTLGFQLLIDQTVDADKGAGFFRGLTKTTGRQARRVLQPIEPNQLVRLRQAVRRRRNIQQLGLREEIDPAWLAHLDNLTDGLPRQTTGEILYQLGQKFYLSGRQEMAAGTFQMLANRYSEHALAESALVWLVQYYASSELALSVNPHSFDKRISQALALKNHLRRSHPDLAADPRMQFPLAVAHRHAAEDQTAAQLMATMRRGPIEQCWRACVEGERWLEKRKGTAPKSLLLCPSVNGRPYLDGQLDDPCWASASRTRLKSPFDDDHDWPAEILLAHDQIFLYLGVDCRKPSDYQYTHSNEARPRDADLTARDRVDLLLDIDRDFTTYYRLTVDHRGWTGESCWNDATWNPTWYVAAQENKDAWTVESAIPLAELTGSPSRAREVWAVGAQRIVPGIGFQSWTQPADVDVVPRGLGYLIFE